MWIIITAHSESILSYQSIKYGRDISRGDSISTKIRSGRVAIEIKIGMPILIYPNIWDGSGSLSSNFRDKNWGKLRFSLTFPDVFWLVFSNFETKSWEKSRTIPTLPDFGSGWQSQFISPMAVSMSGFYLLSAVPSSKSLAASIIFSNKFKNNPAPIFPKFADFWSF